LLAHEPSASAQTQALVQRTVRRRNRLPADPGATPARYWPGRLHPSFLKDADMQALVYNGPGRKNVEDRIKPVLTMPGDAIVRITRTTICGTDLHILKGDVATCKPGTILGHEGVGIIDAVGAAVTSFKPGDHVLISCISACGRCEPCRKGMY
jgi:hypothetical protein